MENQEKNAAEDSPRRKFPIWLSFVLMVTVVLIASIGYFKSLGHHGDQVEQTVADNQDSGQSEVRTEAPDIHFQDASGKTLHLKDYRGKVVLLSFWASWCGPCIEEMPTFVKIAEKFKPQGFEVLDVNVDENEQDAREFIKTFWKIKQISFAPFFDQDKSAQVTYKVDELPSNFIIDRHGKIAFSGYGANDWSSPDVMASLETILKEK